uniref:Protein CUSTOS n=1 Tax=Latimeria chalumnae TaxID=7897 RepID=H3BEP5_LATCH
MAAPVCSAASSDSEGSEELERLREATWDFGTSGEGAIGSEGPKKNKAKTRVPSVRASLRQKTDVHEHDGNELQTTPEFRAHVAKKLGALLDSFIAIPEDSPEQVQASMLAEGTSDEGFRLFSTSVAGDHGKLESPPPVKRQLPSSSSNSDSEEEWQKFKEAAVSSTDILQFSTLPSLHQGSKQVKDQEEVKTKKKKKKKQKKKKPLENAEEEKPVNGEQGPEGMGELLEGAQEQADLDSNLQSLTKKKKKKRKKRRLQEVNYSPPPLKTPLHTIIAVPLGEG